VSGALAIRPTRNPTALTAIVIAQDSAHVGLRRPCLCRDAVVDGGSVDATAELAERHGAA
jgi:hypothetical protein